MKSLSLPLRLAFYVLPFLPATAGWGQTTLPANPVDQVTLSADSLFQKQFSKLSGRSPKPESMLESDYQALCNRLMRHITAQVDTNTLTELNKEGKTNWNKAQWEKACKQILVQDIVLLANGQEHLFDYFFKRTSRWQLSDTLRLRVTYETPFGYDGWTYPQPIHLR